MSGRDDSRALPLQDAAAAMGISTEALRKRIKRQSVDAFKDNQNRWRVFVPEAVVVQDTGRTGQDGRPDDDALIAELRSRIGDLERQVEDGRKREERLLALIEQLTPQQRRSVWELFSSYVGKFAGDKA